MTADPRTYADPPTTIDRAEVPTTRAAVTYEEALSRARECLTKAEQVAEPGRAKALARVADSWVGLAITIANRNATTLAALR